MAVVAIAPVEPAVLTNGEIRGLALRNLALGPRQRRPNQRTMDPFVIRVARSLPARTRGPTLDSTTGSGSTASAVGTTSGRSIGAVSASSTTTGGSGSGTGGRANAAASVPVHQRGLRLLAPRGRHLGLLIFVVRVAGGAACLLHLVFNHRDDRMIRDAALARTVVVQNVTEPNPALLHELPRSDAFRVGWGNYQM